MRPTMLKRLFTGTVVVAIALVAAACGASGPGGGGDSDKITIGGLSFLTGKFSSYGEDAKRGMELAQKEINASGGVRGGAQLDLRIEDTASDPAQAVTLLRRYAGDRDVVGVVGPVGTPDLLATLAVAGQLKTPVVSLGSQAPLTKDKFADGVVRVNLVETPELLGDVLAEMHEKLDISTIGLLSDRANDYAEAERVALEKAAKGDVTIVGKQTYAQGDKSFASPIDRVLRSRPDALWIAGTTNEAGLIMQQARARGFDGRFLGGAGLNDPAIAKIAKGNATGYVTILPMDMSGGGDPVTTLRDSYRKEYGDGPVSAYTAYGYDAVQVLARAIDDADSLDRASVMRSLGAVTKYKGVTGTYSFDGKGDNTTPKGYLFEMTKAGTFERLGKS